jgi:hypothetical protein
MQLFELLSQSRTVKLENLPELNPASSHEYNRNYGAQQLSHTSPPQSHLFGQSVVTASSSADSCSLVDHTSGSESVEIPQEVHTIEEASSLLQSVLMQMMQEEEMEEQLHAASSDPCSSRGEKHPIVHIVGPGQRWPASHLQRSAVYIVRCAA